MSTPLMIQKRTGWVLLRGGKPVGMVDVMGAELVVEALLPGDVHFDTEEGIRYWLSRQPNKDFYEAAEVEMVAVVRRKEEGGE